MQIRNHKSNHFSIQLTGILLIFFLFSCMSTNEDIEIYNKDYTDILGKKIEFTKNLKLYNGVSATLKKKKILVTGASDCGNCIEQLEVWNQYLAEHTFDDTEVIFVLLGSDNKEFRHYIKNSKYANISVFLDTTATFVVANSIPAKYYQKAMLLDDSNHVELVGDPIDNETISAYYHDLIGKN